MDKDIQLLRLCYTADVNPTTGYRGLIQVCRQVRKEFRPLYQAHNVYVEIDIWNAARYVTTFNDLSDHKALAKVNGSIEINLNNGCYDDPNVDQTELLPLLRLLALAPDLHARIVATAYISEDGVPQWIHDLNCLLRIPKMMSVDVRYGILYMIEKTTLSSVRRPELTLWLARHYMSSDYAIRSHLLERMKLNGLVGLHITCGTLEQFKILENPRGD